MEDLVLQDDEVDPALQVDCVVLHDPVDLQVDPDVCLKVEVGFLVLIVSSEISVVSLGRKGWVGSP